MLLVTHCDNKSVLTGQVYIPNVTSSSTHK